MFRWGGVLVGSVDGVVGPDVSKTEGIKASVAWGIFKKPCDDPVFSLCFRCAFGVALHGARADLLRFGHLAPSMRRPDTRAGPSGGAGLGRGTRGCLGLVMDEGLHHQRGFETDHEGQGLIIRDEAGLEGSSPR